MVGAVNIRHFLNESLLLNGGHIGDGVVPSERRKGIATSLIRKLIEYGAENNLDYITLEVRQSNIPAINLYSNNGFEKVGVRKKYYSTPTEDAILMNYTYPIRKE